MKKWIFIGIIGLAFLVVLGVVLAVGLRACSVVEIITDPDRMISTYEKFFNTRADILVYEQQLNVANKAVETFKADHAGSLDTYTNSQELSRLRAVAQGIENILISTCQSYNANALNKTRGIFKDWSLPYQINYENGKVTEIY